MIQNDTLEDLAELIAGANLVTKVALGTSGQLPTRADTGLKGSPLANTTMASSVVGNSVKYVSPVVTVGSGDAQEIALLDAADVLRDRMVIPTLRGATGATFQFEYTLTVVASGEN